MNRYARILLAAAIALCGTRSRAADSLAYRPDVHATIRAKYEYRPQMGKGRFEIRNARVSIQGRLLPVVNYKAEIDLSDEGAIRMLDTYVMFAAYRLPLKRIFSAVTFLGRYDYMSDHSKGIADENGALQADDPQRHRLTGGITLSLGTSKLQTDIRINYERYVYRPDSRPPVSERNKAVIEFMCHF